MGMRLALCIAGKGKSPIFTYAELVSNSYSSEEVQFMPSRGTSGVTIYYSEAIFRLFPSAKNTFYYTYSSVCTKSYTVS